MQAAAQRPPPGPPPHRAYFGPLRPLQVAMASSGMAGSAVLVLDLSPLLATVSSLATVPRFLHGPVPLAPFKSTLVCGMPDVVQLA